MDSHPVINFIWCGGGMVTTNYQVGKGECPNIGYAPNIGHENIFLRNGYTN